MKVYKFGGASIKDAQAIKNICQILKAEQENNIVIVLSAMGKTTNGLEAVVNQHFGKEPTSLEQVKSYHLQIAHDLFSPAHPIFDDINNLFVEIEWVLEDSPSTNYDYEYDQIVSVGELLSTKIVSAYLSQEELKNQWLDARDLIQTNNTYRNARINWESTVNNIQQKVSSQGICLTQGFIGCTSENFSTTLGREGSDFSAAILGYALDAESVTIWKDVDGMLNADPRFFEDAVLIEQLPYSEAIELAYYGAKVVHPKTIQPLKEKNIPLYIKSFLNPQHKGTLISDNTELKPFIPSFIIKENQILLSISARDLSFIVEDHLSHIFSVLSTVGISVNLMQNSAVSFSICADDDKLKIPSLVNELKRQYNVTYFEALTLCTIRHYSPDDIQRIIREKTVLLEQKTSYVVQFVY